MIYSLFPPKGAATNMAVKQAKFDINSRPRKANAPDKVRPGSEVSDKADKRWWRLAQASIDDTYPVDRGRAAKDAISEYKRDSSKMSAAKSKPRKRS